jgi:hypothetical protein
MTGYTATLTEKDQTFEQFVWACARNFGALITMRDDPMDAPVPELFELRSYYSERVEEARKELQAFGNCSDVSYTC